MPSLPGLIQDSDFMRAVLDLVIPPREDGVVPGAGSLGLGGPLAERLRRDDRYGAPVEAGLAAVHAEAINRHPDGFLALTPDEQVDVLESQLIAHPALIRGITRHLYLVYYQHPKVLAGLDQPSRPPFPDGFDVEETDPALLEILETRKIAPPESASLRFESSPRPSRTI